VNTDRIPLDVADLDAGWFERVLGCAIESVELVDAHSGTTGRARVRVEVADPPESRPLFVKLAPFDARQRAFVAEQGMGVAEARFYRDVARHCPIRIPRAVHADHDGERYVMVLEDIVAAGARFPRTRDDDILQIVEGVIDNFAALHGAYWQSARLAAGGDLEWIAHRTRGYGGGGGRFVRMAVDAFGDRMPPAFHALAAVYCSRGREIADLIAEGAATLVHGDAHLGNMYAVGTAPGFLDWAMIGHAPGMRDVAYFLCNSVPTELRRAEEHRLLDRYRAGLATAGVTLAAQDAWAQYRMQAVTGWVAAVSTAGMGARWQPERIGLAGTARANATIDDLGTVEALRAALGDG
jgi:aminoglycoside phosphotransferase (APT) family kinase protein